MPVVCIDPGHGGSDPGAIGSVGTKEKDVNLKVALMLGEKLQHAGLTVFYTRMVDVRLGSTNYADIMGRASIANNSKTDYFVSLHCNSNAGTPGDGIETYVIARGGKAEKLADSVQASLVAKMGLRNRGVKTKDLGVLRETKMPAILVEMAFINNQVEEQMLLDRPIEFADSIAAGVLNYLGISPDIPPPADTPPWYAAEQAWAMEKGITDGTRPDEKMTRAEGWAMMKRLYDLK